MRTLVLNAGYEPLSVVSFKRAVVLVLDRKAMVLAETGDYLHSAELSLGTPSVILLVRYVRTPRRHSVAVSRRGVLRRDGHRCAYCGNHAETVDHVHPRSRGGRHEWTNVVAACVRCNHRKADRLLHEIGWELPFVPRAPRWSVAFGTTSVRTEPLWSQYVVA